MDIDKMLIMEDLREYLKYYDLEKYLFEDVHNNFLKNHYLEDEDFFAIVIWKSNRAKTKIVDGLKRNKKTIRKITSDIFQAEYPEGKLEILTQISGIGIPIASAILTVCYPDVFTVVDYRARDSLKAFGEEIEGDPSTKPTAYFNYLSKCKVLAKNSKVSLRDFDRILWAKSWKNDLKDMLKM